MKTPTTVGNPGYTKKWDSRLNLITGFLRKFRVQRVNLVKSEINPTKFTTVDAVMQYNVLSKSNSVSVQTISVVVKVMYNNKENL